MDQLKHLPLDGFLEILTTENHMQEIHSLLESIPCISTRLAAVIEAEVGDFKRFSSPDKIFAFAGLSPTTYQQDKYTSPNAVMEKRGSRYLRCALFLATHLVGRYSKTFAAYLKKKRDEGKHYFVALSHVAKKLFESFFIFKEPENLFLILLDSLQSVS